MKDSPFAYSGLHQQSLTKSTDMEFEMAIQSLTEVTNNRNQTMSSREIAEICHIAFSEGWHEGIKRLNSIDLSTLDEPNTHLFNAALGYIGELIELSNNEAVIQNKFFDKLDFYIQGAKKIDIKMDKEHKPDGFVVLDNEIYPVEVKKNTFDINALKQLTRYMRYYKCKKGIAVAPYLSCCLPDDVSFVPVSCVS